MYHTKDILSHVSTAIWKATAGWSQGPDHCMITNARISKARPWNRGAWWSSEGKRGGLGSTLPQLIWSCQPWKQAAVDCGLSTTENDLMWLNMIASYWIPTKNDRSFKCWPCECVYLRCLKVACSTTGEGIILVKGSLATKSEISALRRFEIYCNVLRQKLIPPRLIPPRTHSTKD